MLLNKLSNFHHFIGCLVCSINKTLCAVPQSNVVTASTVAIHHSVTLGATEWQSSDEGLAAISTFWSGTISSVGNLIQLSHKFDKNWPLIPILGYEDSPLNNDISSILSRNQSAFNLYQAGLRMVGQLFNVNSRREVGVSHQLHLVLTGLGVITPRNICLLNLYFFSYPRVPRMK